MMFKQVTGGPTVYVEKGDTVAGIVFMTRHTALKFVYENYCGYTLSTMTFTQGNTQIFDGCTDYTNHGRYGSCSYRVFQNSYTAGFTDVHGFPTLNPLTNEPIDIIIGWEHKLFIPIYLDNLYVCPVCGSITTLEQEKEYPQVPSYYDTPPSDKDIQAYISGTKKGKALFTYRRCKYCLKNKYTRAKYFTHPINRSPYKQQKLIELYRKTICDMLYPVCKPKKLTKFDIRKYVARRVRRHRCKPISKHESVFFRTILGAKKLASLMKK